MNDDRGHEAQNKYDARYDLVGQVDAVRVVAAEAGNERPNHKGHANDRVRVEEVFQAVVVVAVGIIGAGTRQEIAIGPVKPERHPHQQSGRDQARQAQVAERHHHQHRHAAQEHAEGIESLDADVFEQPAVYEEREPQNPKTPKPQNPNKLISNNILDQLNVI